MRNTKTLIRLHGCAGLFEFSAHVRRYVFPRWGPYCFTLRNNIMHLIQLFIYVYSDIVNSLTLNVQNSSVFSLTMYSVSSITFKFLLILDIDITFQVSSIYTRIVQVACINNNIDYLKLRTVFT